MTCPSGSRPSSPRAQTATVPRWSESSLAPRGGSNSLHTAGTGHRRHTRHTPHARSRSGDTAPTGMRTWYGAALLTSMPVPSPACVCGLVFRLHHPQLRGPLRRSTSTHKQRQDWLNPRGVVTWCTEQPRRPVGLQLQCAGRRRAHLRSVVHTERRHHVGLLTVQCGSFAFLVHGLRPTLARLTPSHNLAAKSQTDTFERKNSGLFVPSIGRNPLFVSGRGSRTILPLILRRIARSCSVGSRYWRSTNSQKCAASICPPADLGTMMERCILHNHDSTQNHGAQSSAAACQCANKASRAEQKGVPGTHSASAAKSCTQAKTS